MESTVYCCFGLLVMGVYYFFFSFIRQLNSVSLSKRKKKLHGILEVLIYINILMNNLQGFLVFCP